MASLTHPLGWRWKKFWAAGPEAVQNDAIRQTFDLVCSIFLLLFVHLDLSDEVFAVRLN
jgi:hypothetical protein